MGSKIVKIFVCIMLMSTAVMFHYENAKAESNTTVTFNPTDDAYVNRNPNNYGDRPHMYVRNRYGADSSNWSWNSLVMFDVSLLPSNATIISASLNLYYYGWKDNNPAGRILECNLNEFIWDEGNVTGPTQPTCNAWDTQTSVVPSSPGNWMRWDVSQSVQAFVAGTETNYGWKITDETYWGSVNIPITKFWTKDSNYSDYIPYLSVEYTTSEVNDPPDASFTHAASDLNVNFTDTSTDSDGIIVSWLWNFGDNITSNEQNPFHTYSSEGTYTVFLTVTDDDGDSDSCSSILYLNDSVNDPPVAGFTYTHTYGMTYYFNDASVDYDGTIVSWLWNFGDNVTSTEQNPTHAYTTTGMHYVTITVTDDDGDSDSFSSWISVYNISNDPPVASFTSSASGLTVSFTDTSTDSDGTIVSWLWNFGDNITSNEQNPTHSYSSPGTYYVSLTVTDNAGGIDTCGNYVTVVQTNPVAIFNPTDDAYVNRNPANYGDRYYMYVRNRYGADSINWSWNSLVMFDVSSLPSDATIISASLNLYYYGWKDNNPAGRILECNLNEFIWDEGNVTGPTQPTCNAWDTQTSVVPSSPGNWMRWDVSQSVQAFVAGTKTNYGWKITDETYWGSVNIPITKFWTKDSNYSDYIPYLFVEYNSSSQNNIPPVADFTYSSNGLNVNFTDTSTDSDGIIVSWLWNFGDNITSNEQNPFHTYSSEGTYTVFLTVTDDDGDSDSVNKLIIVSIENTTNTTMSGSESGDDDKGSDDEEPKDDNNQLYLKLFDFLNKYFPKISKLIMDLMN